MMFQIYTKEFKLKDASGNEETYRLRPLTGRFLPKLFGIMGKLSTGEGEVDMSKLDEEAMAKLHMICLETFKRSYPNEKEEALDEFVSQNLLRLIEPVFAVNMNPPEE